LVWLGALEEKGSTTGKQIGLKDRMISLQEIATADKKAKPTHCQSWQQSGLFGKKIQLSNLPEKR
jgi:hypothetical protein